MLWTKVQPFWMSPKQNIMRIPACGMTQPWHWALSSYPPWSTGSLKWNGVGHHHTRHYHMLVYLVNYHCKHDNCMYVLLFTGEGDSDTRQAVIHNVHSKLKFPSKLCLATFVTIFLIPLLQEHLQIALSLLLKHFQNQQFSLFWVMVFIIQFPANISGTPVYLRYLQIENINLIHNWTEISQ